MINPFAPIRRFATARFEAFLDKRLPLSNDFILNQKRIYIIPSKTGAGFIFLLLLMLLVAINYQNNLVYLVVFWLAALLVVNILFTYRNLSGIRLVPVVGNPCFAGENASFELDINCTNGKEHLSIEIGWPDQDWLMIDLEPDEQIRIKLSHQADQRGLLKAPRIKLLTRFPTGLARAWAFALLDMSAIVYPKPELGLQIGGVGNQGNEMEDGAEIPRGSADFSGVRPYQAGDAPKHIHWPVYARTGELATRQFVDYQTHDLWLDYDELTFNGVERRLSHLCARVLELNEQQQTWGLKLPGKTVDPDHGIHHRDRCLAALALFGLDEDETPA